MAKNKQELHQYCVYISRECVDTFMVNASSEAEARDLALDEAYNADWSCIEPDYDIYDVEFIGAAQYDGYETEDED